MVSALVSDHLRPYSFCLLEKNTLASIPLLTDYKPTSNPDCFVDAVCNRQYDLKVVPQCTGYDSGILYSISYSVKSELHRIVL